MNLAVLVLAVISIAAVFLALRIDDHRQGKRFVGREIPLPTVQKRTGKQTRAR